MADFVKGTGDVDDKYTYSSSKAGCPRPFSVELSEDVGSTETLAKPELPGREDVLLFKEVGDMLIDNSLHYLRHNGQQGHGAVILGETLGFLLMDGHYPRDLP